MKGAPSRITCTSLADDGTQTIADTSLHSDLHTDSLAFVTVQHGLGFATNGYTIREPLVGQRPTAGRCHGENTRTAGRHDNVAGCVMMVGAVIALPPVVTVSMAALLVTPAGFARC